MKHPGHVSLTAQFAHQLCVGGTRDPFGHVLVDRVPTADEVDVGWVFDAVKAGYGMF